MDDRELVAYHEAAHAVAYYALWRPFEYVTTVPDDDCAGHVQGMPLPPDPNCWFEGNFDALVGDVAVTRLAGPVAERARRCDVTYEVDDIWGQLTTDDKTTVDMALEHSSTVATENAEGRLEYDVGATLEKLLSAAVGIVMEMWGPIEAVAGALLEEDTLSAVRVYEIIRTAPSSAPPFLRDSPQEA